MSGRTRLDVALEQRGLVPSRSRARDAIARGTVTVNGDVATKAGQPVGVEDVIAIDDPASGYVSRAALKLIAGLDASGFDPQGKICLDLGASTGGFTQVLLERGAARVYAVDVGHGQLHPDIAADLRVTSLEGTNARDLDAGLIPDPIDLLVSDVSFVSLTKILDAPLALCAADAQAVLLIKPQFEVGRAHVGKGGIVAPGPHVAAAVAAVLDYLAASGWRLVGQIESPVKGGDGNQETVAFFSRPTPQS
ncbi:SAM-dependent methyltransferase [Pelagibacterium limicola]|uniref:SAM-dependent methyltransferase n=1 Tax=Pelagibacterium limicola TaxID=2791022 RepID=UPI0018AFDBB8